MLNNPSIEAGFLLEANMWRYLAGIFALLAPNYPPWLGGYRPVALYPQGLRRNTGAAAIRRQAKKQRRQARTKRGAYGRH